MGLFGSLLNGHNAAKAAKIIMRITDRPCDENQLSDLKRSAQSFSMNEFEFAFLQLHRDYLCGPKVDFLGNIYADYKPTEVLKARIRREYEDFRSKGLIRNSYLVELYEEL